LVIETGKKAAFEREKVVKRKIIYEWVFNGPAKIKINLVCIKNKRLSPVRLGAPAPRTSYCSL
jgi:hypothetical protein